MRVENGMASYTELLLKEGTAHGGLESCGVSQSCREYTPRVIYFQRTLCKGVAVRASQRQVQSTGASEEARGSRLVAESDEREAIQGESYLDWNKDFPVFPEASGDSAGGGLGLRCPNLTASAPSDFCQGSPLSKPSCKLGGFELGRLCYDSYKSDSPSRRADSWRGGQSGPGGQWKAVSSEGF